MSDVTRFRGFNTQPPKGGWAQTGGKGGKRFEFQHTAA